MCAVYVCGMDNHSVNHGVPRVCVRRKQQLEQTFFLKKKGQRMGDHIFYSFHEVRQDHQHYSNCLVFVMEES